MTRASCRNRSTRRPGASTTSVDSSLMATIRSSCRSRARYTSPIPPTPISVRISNRPRREPGATLIARSVLPGCGAPALAGVFGPGDFAVWHRADGRPHLHLFVPLDRRLGGAAVFLAPDEGHFVADRRVLRLENRQRQHLAGVGAVAHPGRDTDSPAVLRHLVVGVHRVDGRGELDELGAMVALELAADRPHHVIGVERERHLGPMRSLGALLEGLAADEIVVELHVRAV